MMRILGFLLFSAIALWLVDITFYDGRYGKRIWRELNQQAQKANYEVRRWTSF